MRIDSGKPDYERDCLRRPNYPDGAPRREWAALDAVAQWSWNRAAVATANDKQQQTETATRVIFRVWSNGDVLALFPDLPADVNGLHVTSYEHVGQHGAADYAGCIGRTRAARPDEYAALAKELTSIGYRLNIRRRR